MHTRTLLYHMTAQRRPHTHNGTCTHASRAQQALDWRPLLPLSLSFSYHHHISLHHRHNHPMAALRRTSQRFPPPAWPAAAGSQRGAHDANITPAVVLSALPTTAGERQARAASACVGQVDTWRQPLVSKGHSSHGKIGCFTQLHTSTAVHFIGFVRLKQALRAHSS